MKVYMVDDTVTKQQRVINILRHLNNRAEHSAMSIEAGFGTDADSAVDRCRDPQELLEVFLHETHAIFLVDLNLGVVGDSHLRLMEDLRAAADSPPPNMPGDRALALGRALEKYQRAAVGNEQLALIVREYPLAIFVMVLAKEVGFPAILTTTYAREAEIHVIAEREKLAIRPPRAIYSEQLDVSDATGHEKDLIELWCAKLSEFVNPFDRIRGATAGWFSKGTGIGWRNWQAHGLPHNADWKELPLTAHRECVQRVFPWYPEKWWADERKANAFHECLKGTYGDHAAWIGRGEQGRPFPLGGAYLIFLEALYRRFPEKLTPFLLDDWSLFTKQGENPPPPLPFLPSQPIVDAGRSIRALFQFFDSIIPLQGEEMRLGVTQIEPPSPRHAHFRLKLDWTPAQLEKCGQTMMRCAQQAFDGTLNLGEQKTVGSFLRFVIASQVHTDGLGTSSTLTLENGWLRIGR